MYFRSSIIIALSALLLATCSEPKSMPTESCIAMIKGVTEIPFKNGIEASGNYYSILEKTGDALTTNCLLEQITNTNLMPDPRMCVPNRRESVAIGDTAIFLLTDMYDVSYTKFVDKENWEKSGIFSYFDLVELDGSREIIAHVMRQEIDY